MEQKKKSIGGLRAKTSKKGLDYMNGWVTIEGKTHNLVVFKNNKKFDENTPDYAIYLSEPMPKPELTAAGHVDDIFSS